MGVSDQRECCGRGGVERTGDVDGHASLTTLLVEALAEYKGVEPLDLDFPLYESIDPEALDDCFASASGTELRTEFTTAGVTVCACKSADDELVVRVWDADE